MSKTWKWIIGVVVGFILTFLVAKVVGGDGDKAEKVVTEKATRRTILESVKASGKIYPEIEVKVSPDIAGQIVELNVEEGDTVKQGTVLAKIYADIYALQRDEAASRVNQSSAGVANSKAALESQKAGVDLAQQAYDRNKTLFDQKVISRSEFETYETNLRTAKAGYQAALENIRSLEAGVQGSRTGLSKANKDLSRTTIVAPMDGVISSLKVKKGESVTGNSFNVGTEMMTIADMSTIEVRVSVPENDIPKVKLGDLADIEVDAYSKRKFKGKVTKIATSVSSAGSLTSVSTDATSYEVRIRIDIESYRDLLGKGSFPFRPGMNASADIFTKKNENVIAVPINAITSRVKGSDQNMADKRKENEEKKEETGSNIDKSYSETDLEEVVFVLQPDGTVKKVVVESGIQDMTYIEVLKGLNPGTEIVVDPYTAISKTLKDGMKVKVVTKDELRKTK
jgi:HlyD family secretion protein